CGSSVRLEASGRSAYWALAAMALSDGIASAEIEASFLELDEAQILQRMYVPHFMRVGGMRTVLSLCAPRPLLLRRAPQAFFEAAEAIYTAAGSPASVRMT